MTAAILTISGTLSFASCSNSDNPSQTDTTGLSSGITSALAPGVIASAIAGTGLTEVQLANQVCYLVDSEAGSNGKTKITQIGDQVISALLADRKDLLEKYNAAGDKRTRQSALNVLSVLRAAGLLE